MAYKVEFTQRATREFNSLPRQAQVRLAPKIEALADEPRPPGVRKLTDEEDYYWIRVGNYRVIYTIRDDALIVLVVDVGDRRDIYRRGWGS
jgi:mRNA interferase RelE/StbE